MESSLHRQMKEFYSRSDASFEGQVGRYRIDVVLPDRLVEVQLGPLVVLRRKAIQLLHSNNLLIVKPIIAVKHIIRLRESDGSVLTRRRSPKHGNIWEFFHDLIHFCQVFPHPRLHIDIPMVEIEELRYPGPNHRLGKRGYRIADQRLVSIRGCVRLRDGRDLLRLLPAIPCDPFYSRDLADCLSVPHWVGQRIAYCLHQCGVSDRIGKTRRGYLYAWRATAAARRSA